ncbi:MAG TPA: 2,3-bisphosphoglycerate-independent phosphoglycerate mutase [Thermomicrobiales bacterium]|nr:2,3-bisphosphoglycerate-independent phosphoglycerate mutase [Thermomicrobiales bacterium]
MTDHKKPVLLAILDGWGIGRGEPGNAVLAADTPNLDRLLEKYPHASLVTSGEAVGLPEGQMGNSEVGHMNLGAGFVVYQWITRIDKAIADGELATNETLQKALAHAREGGGTVHFLGLVGHGGVHSHTRHLLALVDAAVAAGNEKILVHAFTDGRDTSPTSGDGFVAEVEEKLKAIGKGRIASVSGRYFAMDRDHRWDRTQKAFDAIVHANGPTADDARAAIREAHDAGTTDEFIVPTVIRDKDGSTHHVDADDSVIFFNFRSDRGRQLTEAMSVADFDGFDRGDFKVDLDVTTLTTYEESLPVHVIFPPHDVKEPLAKVISDAGMTQFHTAETEKYPHVTFFLNGGREEPFPGEERHMVQSPKVATYDLQPEMSAAGVKDGVLEAIRSGTYDFIIVNFANDDMVGHTGSIPAVIEAVETVDTCIGEVVDALLAAGGSGIITADHGNAEEMIDRKTGGPMTSHTTNPVPVILVAPDDSPRRHATLRTDGVLSAVTTTILDLLDLEPPSDMTQPGLIVGEERSA